MEKHTDESVKTGLQIESNKDLLKEQHTVSGQPAGPSGQGSVNEQKKNDTGTGYKDPLKETDADELVHEKKIDIDAGNKEQDPDELVHSSTSFKTVKGNEEVDPDDLVHENNEDPFDE